MTCPSEGLALRALAMARREIGYGEEWANNTGVALSKYRSIFGITPGSWRDSGPWCADFISWCFARAAQFEDLPFQPSRGARRLTKNIGKAGRFMNYPEPGAVICWRRPPVPWAGHVGICEEYHLGTDTLQWIDGNKGDFPARVQTRVVAYGAWRKRLYRIAKI